jgi:hypothetical protein
MTLLRKMLGTASLSILSILATVLFGAIATPAQAAQGWGLGIGYHNPVSSNLGVSFLYAGQSFGFEAAIGGLGASGGDDSDSGSGAYLAGDVDIKYFFGKGTGGYVEAGVGYGIAVSTSGGGFGANLGQGGAFAGGGIMFAGSSLYGLIGGDYLFSTKHAVFMATLGFWL